MTDSGLESRCGWIRGGGGEMRMGCQSHENDHHHHRQRGRKRRKAFQHPLIHRPCLGSAGGDVAAASGAELESKSKISELYCLLWSVLAASLCLLTIRNMSEHEAAAAEHHCHHIIVSIIRIHPRIQHRQDSPSSSASDPFHQKRKGHETPTTETDFGDFDLIHSSTGWPSSSVPYLLLN